MHTCSKCKSLKEASMFYKSKQTKSGLHAWCKACVLASQREYGQRNKEKISARNKQYRSQHREAIVAKDREYYAANKTAHNARVKAYYEANKEQVIAYQKQYAKDHPEVVAEYKRRTKVTRPDTVKAEYERNKTAYFARAAERRAIKTSRLPAWADKEVINEFYRVAQAFNAQYPEIGFHVDHIVPLKSKVVSGLHTDANLQILTGKENMTKGNRTWPNQYS